MAVLSDIITPTNILTASNTAALTNKTIAFGSNTLTDVAGTSATQTLTNKTIAAATNNVEARSAPSATSFGFRNRVINGDMVIDQRNAGASVTLTASNVYNLDRWYARAATGSGTTAIQSTTVPPNYKNSLLITVGTGASPGTTDNNYIAQRIEGFNMADFGWGTATATTVTLSFWVRSSLGPGTFGGAIQNADVTRSYPFTYTISAANTWEQKSVTIAGDTSGTWLTTNGIGATMTFDLGTGATYQGTAGSWASADYRAATGAVKTIATSGATFYITGVQLEAGSVATPFEQINYGTELMMCQRYYEKSYPIGTVPGASAITSGMSWLVNGYSSNIYVICTTTFKATKRTAAAIAYWDAAGNSLRTTYLTGGGLSQGDNNNNIYATVASESGFFIYILAAPSYNYGVQWTASAEL
jgi:hypothetical protein